MDGVDNGPRKLSDVPRFTGPDGATVREAAGRSTGLASHSLAFITHPAGTASRRHHHTVCEEVYYVAAGRGRIDVDGVERELAQGDLVQIRPGQQHKVYCDGPQDLELIVTCGPAYSMDEVAWDEE